MATIRVSVDSPNPADLDRAAELLLAGRLVAFPTETVYGLGANALDPAAVQRIYDAKGRPPLNPLIVHVSSIAMARELAAEWPELAERLAQRFWPGPLTLVVKKTARIPDVVTAGGATVGLRIPSHAIALGIIERAGVPVAAPSANRSNQISPTTAAHVERSLGDRVDLIIDGGETTVGIESTVVDVTGDAPRVLRPGMISVDDIGHAVGTTAQVGEGRSRRESPRSPGMLGKHYAPRGRLALFHRAERKSTAGKARRAVANGTRVGAMVLTPLGVPGVVERTMAGNARDYARDLYATLHSFDAEGCDLIFVEEPPATEEWRGVRDRLNRASREG
jgi:L-threonylcarbamoyladenylate synthase